LLSNSFYTSEEYFNYHKWWENCFRNLENILLL
jgi:hypothetical protein